MELTVLIPFWNGHQHIDRLLSSLPNNLPVIIIDDHSDEPLQLNKRNVQVIRPEEKGYFTGAVNAGIGACKTDVLILNQDTWLEGTAALDLIMGARKNFALIGERITGEHPAFPGHGYIHGTFMFIRRDAVEQVGLMDAKHFPLWGSTADYQLRVCRAGFRAMPIQHIPGFRHKRGSEKFGSAISEIIRRRPEMRPKLIRTAPLISVVINAYNHGRYLDDAVNSLIGGPTSLGHMRPQTFQGFEIIIVDDGSTDNTPEIGKRLADSWKGIRYMRQRNRGSAAAMNRGINAAYGRYIAPLDADDMMRVARLEMMLGTCEANPHHVACDSMILFRDGEYLKLPDGELRVWNMIPYDFETIIHKNTMHKGLMYPKQAWIDAGGYPVAMNRGREDWAFNVALGIKGWCGIATPYGGYLYRREGQNRTLTNTTPVWRAQFQQQLFELFPNIYAGERPMGCCGNNNSSKQVVGKSASTQMFTGQEGMALIVYLGGNAGTMSWWGEVTGQRYIFGGSRKRGYVDVRDLPGFLNQWEGGRQLFKQVEPDPTPAPVTQEEPKASKPAPVSEPMLDPAAPQEAAVIPTAEELAAELFAEPDSPTPNPQEMKVAEIQEVIVLGNLTLAQLEEMRELEQARDKVRITALRHIEDAIAAYE